MNADGIAYLDIADAYMQGDWHTAINAVWSPMYSWILGLVMSFVNPSMRWEFPVVHFLNFVIYVGALLSFEFFWRQLTDYWKTKARKVSGQESISVPDWAWLTLGYLLFIFFSLNLIKIWAVTPDMLMAAFVFLASGLILKIRIGTTTPGIFIFLGIVLGLGYLAKAVMFPLAFVFLGVTLLTVGNLRRAIPMVSLTLAVFLLLSVPFIAIVSVAKGKVTFGDAGKLTYARYVNGVPYPHWQGNTPGNGTPKHPSRKIFRVPAIYEFGTPIGGTYPVSQDPSYWYEGLTVRFDWKQQLGYLLTSALFYFDLLFRQHAVLMIGILLLYLIKGWRPQRVTNIVAQWGLMIPAIAAFGFYALVNVAGRYVGVFVVLFWADLLANAHIPDSQTSRRLVSRLSALMILFMLMNILAFNLEGFRDFTGQSKAPEVVQAQAGPPSWPGEVAEELHRLGLQPGDKVAVIGYAFDSFWARLARVKIVAEMLDLDANAFWLGEPSVQAKVLSAFASTGARAIVAERVPPYASPTGWHQVGTSNYYIYLLI